MNRLYVTTRSERRWEKALLLLIMAMVFVVGVQVGIRHGKMLASDQYKESK